MKPLTPSELAEALSYGNNIAIQNVRHLGSNRVNIKARWHGEDLSFIASIEEVDQASLPKMLPQADGKEYSAKEASALGLPLYYSAEWLREQLQAHGSIIGVANASGYTYYAIRTAVQRHQLVEDNPAQAEQRQREEIKAQVLAEWKLGKSGTELATTYDVPLPTVYRWTSQARRKRNGRK